MAEQPPPPPAFTLPPPQVLFESDDRACFKIPAIAGNGDGVLIAAVEQRFGTKRYLDFETYIAEKKTDMRDRSHGRLADLARCADWGYANIVFRRSPDGGRTWTEMKPLVDLRNFQTDATKLVFVGNPTITWIPRTSRFILLFVVSRSTGPDNSASCVRAQEGPNRRCKTAAAELDAWQITSDDLGIIWSPPKRVPLRHDALPALFRPGPGHGSILPSGRIVVPAYPMLWLSDDAGETWFLGADNRRPGLVGSETSLAPLPDGRLWALIRMSTRDRLRLTGESHWPLWLMSVVSVDGGLTYETAEATRRFPIPIVQTSLLDVRMAAAAEDHVTVLSAPAVRTPADSVSLHGDRRDLMVAIGDGPDKGSFSAMIVHDGPAGYSDIVALRPGHIGVLYEGTTAPDVVMKELSYVRTVLFNEIDLDLVRRCTKQFEDQGLSVRPSAARCFRF